MYQPSQVQPTSVSVDAEYVLLALEYIYRHIIDFPLKAPKRANCLLALNTIRLKSPSEQIPINFLRAIKDRGPLMVIANMA